MGVERVPAQWEQGRPSISEPVLISASKGQPINERSLRSVVNADVLPGMIYPRRYVRTERAATRVDVSFGASQISGEPKS